MFRYEHVTGESVLTYAVAVFLVVAGVSGFAVAYRMVGWGEPGVAVLNAVSGLLLVGLAAALAWLVRR